MTRPHAFELAWMVTLGVVCGAAACSDETTADTGPAALDGGGADVTPDRGDAGDGTPMIEPRTTRLAAGAGFACALRNGRIKCWGDNDTGQLGIGDTATRGTSLAEMGAKLPPVELGAGRTPVAVSAGTLHACALLDDGSVKCWGGNAAGRLGVGDESARGDGPGEMGDALAAVEFGLGRTAKALTTGGNHTCALLDDGSIKCWGGNHAGQLGRGDVSARGTSPSQLGDALPAVDVGGRGALDVVAGRYHTCALLEDGSVKCWGYNYDGELGIGDTANRGDVPAQMGDALPAVSLGSGRKAKSLVAGAFHACALLDDGSLKCWGRGAEGQLGNGATAARGAGPDQMGDALPAVDLGAGRSAVAVAAGERHTCAVLDDRTVKCWGTNDFGQLGTGSAASRGGSPGEMGDALPRVDLGAGRTAKAIAAGVDHTCAWLDDDTIKCWGRNARGQLGFPPGEPDVWLGKGRTASSIAAGSLHTCAVLDDGTFKCWGGNGNGQLGRGDTEPRGASIGDMPALGPVPLGTGRTAMLATSGPPSEHTCAVLDDASIKCWGRNSAGQLGVGDALDRGNEPNEMDDALAAISLGTGRTAKTSAAGGQHTCALLDNDTVKCWGDNVYGQLGIGSTARRGDQPGQMGDVLPALNLGTGRTAKEVTLGLTYSCARLDDDSVKCWGAGSYLGLGSGSNRGNTAASMGDNLPVVDLGTGRTALSIRAGSTHTCARLDDSTVKCWGQNSQGQLGLGDLSFRGNAPNQMGDNLPAVDLGIGRTAKAISAGQQHTCAVLDDGSVKCWGRNTDGQLGLGDKSSRGGAAGQMGDNLPPVDLGGGRRATAVSAGSGHTCALLETGTVRCWGSNAFGQLGVWDTTRLGDEPGEMGDALPVVDTGL